MSKVILSLSVLMSFGVKEIYEAIRRFATLGRCRPLPFSDHCDCPKSV
jgi:hypothetical protein